MRANQLKTRSRLAQDYTSRLAKDAVKAHRKRVASASQARLKRVSSESSRCAGRLMRSAEAEQKYKTYKNKLTSILRITEKTIIARC